MAGSGCPNGETDGRHLPYPTRRNCGEPLDCLYAMGVHNRSQRQLRGGTVWGNKRSQRKEQGHCGRRKSDRVALFAFPDPALPTAHTTSKGAPPLAWGGGDVARNLQRVMPTAGIMDIPALCVTPEMSAYAAICVCNLLEGRHGRIHPGPCACHFFVDS